MTAAQALSTDVGIVKACVALTVARATYYRRLRASPAPKPRPHPVRALGDSERRDVIDVLTSPRFVDKAPATVFATLLDERRYLCSTRTMYRVLEANHLVRERRKQLRHPAYAKPELLATGANQVWSWDITKLRGAVKWSYLRRKAAPSVPSVSPFARADKPLACRQMARKYLYVILDIFSRYVVGWMVASRESSELACKLFDETIAKEAVPQGQLTIHADRGTSMTSKSVALLLADLGVTKTHSRPHVSDDNPYSESQFKTLKYRPEFPERFGCIEDARAFCRTFFHWYNDQHRHSGISYLTPAMVHHGQAPTGVADRAATLARAYAAHP